MKKSNLKNPFGKYNGNEGEYVLRALDTESKENRGFPWVSELEDKFCELSSSKHAIAVNSGTSGLHAALVAADVGPGDEVIQPALTVVMNSFVTLACGATPVYADINPNTWNIDASSIKEKITQNTKAIMAVSLFGLPLDMEPIMKLAKEHNLLVIDDSAETICGSYKEKFPGTHADMAVYSFENKKHMTSGSEGGMVITSNPDLAQKVRKFAGIGYKNLNASAGRDSIDFSQFQDPNYERQDFIGLNYRMNVITAAVGLAQLERAEYLVNRRISIAKMFEEVIDDCDYLVPQATSEDSIHSYFTYAIKYLGEELKGISWKEFYRMYTSMGGNGFYAAWKNPYLEPALKGKKLGDITLEKGLCPIAEECQKLLMLFKTNHRDPEEAKKDVKILNDLIKEIG